MTNIRYAQEHGEHGGQGSISLEYQTYNSAHLYDTLVTGMAARGSICLASTLFRGPITEKYIQASLTYQERGPFFWYLNFSQLCLFVREAKEQLLAF